MKNFIEQFYYGNINPIEKDYRKNRGEREALRKLNEFTDKFTESLKKEEKRMLIELMDAYTEFTSITGKETFEYAFR